MGVATVGSPEFWQEHLLSYVDTVGQFSKQNGPLTAAVYKCATTVITTRSSLTK